MLSLGASDSSTRASLPTAVTGAVNELDRQLARPGARPDVRDEAAFYGTLLASKVYVVDCELVLGEHEPYVELQPRSVGGRRTLSVYTSRRHMPAGIDPLDAPSMSFVAVLRAADDDVEIVLNPHTALSRRMDVVELELLRRVVERR